MVCHRVFPIVYGEERRPTILVSKRSNFLSKGVSGVPGDQENDRYLFHQAHIAIKVQRVKGLDSKQ